MISPNLVQRAMVDAMAVRLPRKLRDVLGLGPEGRARLARWEASQAAPPTSGAVLERMVTEAKTWHYAAHLQRTRIDAHREIEELEIDFHFLVVALVRLRRSVSLAATVPEVAFELGFAMTAFDDRLPNLKSLGDVAEHVDDYTLDIGRNPRIRRHGLQVMAWTSSQDGDLVWKWLGSDLDVDTAVSAATDLLASLKRAVRQVAETRDQGSPDRSG
ncbi:MAG: hypothetical protein WEC34_00190 [Acidimicrobiia bacterium]